MKGYSLFLLACSKESHHIVSQFHLAMVLFTVQLPTAPETSKRPFMSHSMCEMITARWYPHTHGAQNQPEASTSPSILAGCLRIRYLIGERLWSRLYLFHAQACSLTHREAWLRMKQWMHGCSMRLRMSSAGESASRVQPQLYLTAI